MNYYYDLPADIINNIDDIAKQKVIDGVRQMVDKAETELTKWALEGWRYKMNKVNCVFRFACARDDITGCVEEGMTYREIGELYNSEDNVDKLTFAGWDDIYWNSEQEYWRDDYENGYEREWCVVEKII
jgi:hypothetical protein